MSQVSAVKDKNQRQQIEYRLEQLPDPIYRDIWGVGINVGLRAGDLLALTMEQARAIDPHTKELRIVESKTSRARLVTFNSGAMDIIERRIKEDDDAEVKDIWLFQSKSPKNSRRHDGKAITRRSVGRVFETVGKAITPSVHLGTHSMRKTRGYAMHTAGRSIEEICKALGHKNTASTMSYIGLDADTVKRGFLDFVL